MVWYNWEAHLQTIRLRRERGKGRTFFLFLVVSSSIASPLIRQALKRTIILYDLPLAVAERFGELIVRQDYSAAWDLLAKETQASITPEAIQTEVTTMTVYASSPIKAAQVMEEFVVEVWPGKQSGCLWR